MISAEGFAAAIGGWLREGLSESAALQKAVLLTVGSLDEGAVYAVDPERIARLFLRARHGTTRTEDAKQVRDYTCHLFREADHACRHQDGDGHYLIHPDARCSSACDERNKATAHRSLAPHGFCPFCHIALPMSGVCDWCE